MNEYFCKICGKEISIFAHDYQDAMCSSCCKEAHYDELAQSLQENEETETNFEDEVVCPYCGNRMEDYDSFFIQQGDGECKCDECGKTFNFTTHIEVTYSTSRKE